MLQTTRANARSQGSSRALAPKMSRASVSKPQFPLPLGGLLPITPLQQRVLRSVQARSQQVRQEAQWPLVGGPGLNSASVQQSDGPSRGPQRSVVGSSCMLTCSNVQCAVSWRFS